MKKTIVEKVNRDAMAVLSHAIRTLLSPDDAGTLAAKEAAKKLFREFADVVVVRDAVGDWTWLPLGEAVSEEHRRIFGLPD